MDRQELAAFLRSRRERITAADVGLPAGTRRRTPGLRREEVAQLAFISTEYYTRMEQANAPRPSGEVLAGVARALRLSDSERDHLHRLAGAPLGPRTGPTREVRQSIRDLLDRLPNAAGIVLSATYEVLAWNALAAALMEDFSALAPRDRNLIRWVFLRPDAGAYGLSDVQEFALAATRRLRATSARYPDDPQIHELVAELLAGSAEFARLWESHDVCTAPALKKTFHHPLVGAITVDCDGFDITDTDQQVVLYTAAPGSSSDEALRLLSVIGTQRMDVPG
ncbi:helix-turn-helix transcriptional regulator [Actinoalloteichus hymeniacidonis]|uniref:DNA binding protein with helix-turn-helix domain n=1 Tax=Actinoalloteichus hymeniacidonis TaxID=340345 RepID=A0AAC9HV21_9PSEU|nr:helix-turn-helix transcriptional regulator [Actinoalloteichus hymeniacidonis]AOS65511.1 DNA binding protein with helix-turn-helix domain [Actinoalloteichus hymeniacidonis]MBB5906402.1 transcriptional regulator with XRE-family HTH domain [Actinoalloteichus hymeniacidonis]